MALGSGITFPVAGQMFWSQARFNDLAGTRPEARVARPAGKRATRGPASGTATAMAVALAACPCCPCGC